MVKIQKVFDLLVEDLMVHGILMDSNVPLKESMLEAIEEILDKHGVDKEYRAFDMIEKDPVIYIEKWATFSGTGKDGGQIELLKADYETGVAVLNASFVGEFKVKFD